MESISRLVDRLNQQNLDAALVSDPNAIRYFTGTQFAPGERLLALVVKKTGQTRYSSTFSSPIMGTRR